MRNSLPSFVCLVAVAALALAHPASAVPFKEARIYIEYNDSANDLGFHVSLDAEDWKTLKIVNPAGKTIFNVTSGGAYKELGMTELFFEGAEPSLEDVPLEELLAKMPEGKYKFIGETVDGQRLSSTATLSHAVPDGPVVSTDVGSQIVIQWEEVTAPPEGFPDADLEIVGYQILVDASDPLQVRLPAAARQLTLPQEFVDSLGSGEHPFEVLAIDASGNQTLTEGTFVKP